jgi:L-cystine uptake protein TcyP (sodium:dicarboxylate symporter family)
VLLFAILFGFALLVMGERANTLRDTIDETAHAVFDVIAIVMKAAPIGAFGAMAYTIGRYGPQALGNLFGLIAVFYATAALFVFVVLGTIARIAGFSIFKLIGYIKDELLIVLGTSSSERRRLKIDNRMAPRLAILGHTAKVNATVPLRASSQSGLEDLRSRCRSTPSSKSLPGQ